MNNAQWQGSSSRHIQQRIIVEAQLVLQTPAQFGNGDSDDLTDMPLLVDAYDGVSPLLTGATLVGALRAYLWSREEGYRSADPAPRKQIIPDDKKSLTEILFGGFKQHDDGKQSALIVDDALGENYGVQLRDGVRIDPQTRTADDGGLFNMQVWSAGTTFPIRLELLLTHPHSVPADKLTDYQHRLKVAFLTALQGLTDGGITLGGRKNRGFGRISVSNWRVRQYDLTKPDQLMLWLREGNDLLPQDYAVDALAKAQVFKCVGTIKDSRAYFEMSATFKLDGSLLIRANGQPNSNSPDMVHLTDHTGSPVLSGTSVTGALRQRARRIVRLIRPNPDEWLSELDGQGNRQRTDHSWITDLFGDEEMRGNFKASRLVVEETGIEEGQFDLVQNRVAIDRFTGGAKDSALFNEQPVFGRTETRLHIKLTIRQPEDRDIGLMLLLLKDLWTGDLPLGGESSVGRGRLAGCCATLVHKSAESSPKEWLLTQADDGSIAFENVTPTTLEKFVEALYSEGAENGA